MMNNIKYYKKITSKHSLFDLKLREIWQYRELIGVLTKRSFMVRYRQTILGPFWLFLSPIFNSFLSYIVFGKIAKLGTGQIPAALFYLSGNAIWSYFSGCLNKNAEIFISNKYLFSKVYFPRLCMSISYILSGLIDFFIRMVLVFFLLVYYTIKGTISISVTGLLYMPILLLLIGLQAMSVGIFISSFTTKYRDFLVLTGFILSLWMSLSPIVYPLSAITNPYICKVFYINPMTGFLELFRFLLFGKGQILTGNLIWSCAFTLIMAFFGIVLFNHIEQNFTDTI